MATKRKTKRATRKRVSAALVRFLRKQNPAFKKAAGVRVQRLKGGAMKLTPIRANPYEILVSRWSDWNQKYGPYEVYGHRDTKEEALREARTYRKPGVTKTKIRWVSF